MNVACSAGHTYKQLNFLLRRPAARWRAEPSWCPVIGGSGTRDRPRKVCLPRPWDQDSASLAELGLHVHTSASDASCTPRPLSCFVAGRTRTQALGTAVGVLPGSSDCPTLGYPTSILPFVVVPTMGQRLGEGTDSERALKERPT